MRTKDMNTGRFTPPYDKKVTKTMTKFINRTAPLAFASVALLFASCADDEFTGTKTSASDNTVIGFNMQTSALTRATQSGENAAKALGNMFIVWGEKNESNDGKKAEDANLVFKNYVVRYKKNSANSTTSNTAGWEYVGVDRANFNTNVTPNIGQNTAQTIKYWDDNATSYTFTAVSAKEEDIKEAKVKITKTEGKTGEESGTVYDKGYTIELASGATPDCIFYADRQVISKGEQGYKHEAVKMTFRNFQSKIRFGVYETIPGYKVVVTGVKYGSAEQAVTDKFGVDGQFVTVGTDTKYKVTYEDDKSSNTNKVKVALDGTPATSTTLEAGTDGILKTSKDDPLKTTSADPTYDEKNGAYTAILPNPSNETDMKLTVSYDLYSEDTGEKISCTDRTAVVPAAYCQWKSNYAYTYIFKITDKSADLYPITFDAVVEQDKIGNQETITTVEEPSITTFGYDETNKKVITGKDEYQTGNTIYASVVDQTETGEGSKAVTLSTEEGKKNIALYTVESDDATKYPITEASVANAIEHSTSNGPIKTTTVNISTSGDNTPIIVKSVPSEDGTTRTLSALKWTPTQAATYAVEYTKDNKKTYKIVKVVAAQEGE